MLSSSSVSVHGGRDQRKTDARTVRMPDRNLWKTSRSVLLRQVRRPSGRRVASKITRTIIYYYSTEQTHRRVNGPCNTDDDGARTVIL